MQDNSHVTSVYAIREWLHRLHSTCREYQVLICELWLIAGSRPLQNLRSDVRKGCGHFLGRWDGRLSNVVFNRPLVAVTFEGDFLKTYRILIAAAVMSLISFARPSLAQLEGNHIATSSDHPVAAIQDTETVAQRDARMSWWREARFGMFIHWGLYSIPAGTWNGKQVSGIGE